MGLFDFFKKKEAGRKCSFCGKALLPSDPEHIAFNRLQCMDCYNKSVAKRSSSETIQKPQTQITMDKATPITVPNDFEKNGDYKLITWLARNDTESEELVLGLYYNGLYPENYILIAEGIRYPSHYIVAPTGYIIPKGPYPLSDDRTVYAIIEIAKKLNFPFEFKINRYSIVELIEEENALTSANKKYESITLLYSKKATPYDSIKITLCKKDDKSTYYIRLDGTAYNTGGTLYFDLEENYFHNHSIEDFCDYIQEKCIWNGEDHFLDFRDAVRQNQTVLKLFNKSAINWEDIFSFENISLNMIYIFHDDNTIKSKPTGQIKKIKILSSNINNEGFSFEKSAEIIGIVENNKKKYVRVTMYDCYAEANGRPCEQWTEYYFLITSGEINNLTVENWRNYVKQKMDYYYKVGSYGTGEYIGAFNSEYGE